MLTSLASIYGPNMQYHGPGPGFFNQWPHMMPFGGFFFWILIIVAVIILVIVVSKSKNSGRNQNVSSRETPLEILKKRYAKGELTKEEFERMKQDIE